MNDKTIEDRTPEKDPANPPTQGNWFKRRVIGPFIGSVNEPWYDARGVAVGLFVGLGVPVGLHTLLMALMRVMFRFNFVMAYAVTFLNNPFTIIPLYYGFYVLGSVLLGQEAAMSVHAFEELMAPVLHAQRFWEAVREFLSLGGELLIRWTVGSLVFSGIVTPLGYMGSFWLFKRRRLKKAKAVEEHYEDIAAKVDQERPPLSEK